MKDKREKIGIEDSKFTKRSFEKSKIMSNAPETCRGCYRYSQWGMKCSYYWQKKKECGSKVNDYEEMVSLDQLRRR